MNERQINYMLTLLLGVEGKLEEKMVECTQAGNREALQIALRAHEQNNDALVALVELQKTGAVIQ